MSDSGEKLAGHPPAVKAGGMRVASKHRHQEQDADAYDQKYIDSLPESTLPTPVIISGGTPPKVEKEYSTQAARSYQNKPLPQHSKHTSGQKKAVHIQQPKK